MITMARKRELMEKAEVTAKAALRKFPAAQDPRATEFFKAEATGHGLTDSDEARYFQSHCFQKFSYMQFQAVMQAKRQKAMKGAS